MSEPTQLSGKFHIGQIVVHRRFGYRGVVYDVDSHFSLSEEWYERVALSRPPRDRPWYHVLVDNADQATYVAERNLEPAADRGPIQHPLLESQLGLFNGDAYEPRELAN